MLHPSYSDLMNIANSEVEQGEQPVVNSRYSIVLATAKRARQIIAGSAPLAKNPSCPKPLSIAIEELASSALSKLMQKKRKTTKNNSIQRLPAGIGWLFFILLDKHLFE